MSKLLSINRSMLYYKYKAKKVDFALENEIITLFNANRKVYGTRKLKAALKKVVSRRKIGQIMSKYNLVSKYTLQRRKRKKKLINEENIPNIVSRDFSKRRPLEVVVSDLTYVKVSGKWCYICIIVDLHNREILGFSAGIKKDSALVLKAFSRIKINLSQVEIFHSDRGGEFKNKAIDELIHTFGISRSLSAKGSPYDNAVAESSYSTLKTELIYGEYFFSLEELQLQLFDYVNWYNTKRLHGALGYKSPKEYKETFNMYE